MKTGKVQVVANAMARELVTDATGKVVAVSYIDKTDGSEKQVRCRTVVLAAISMAAQERGRQGGGAPAAAAPAMTLTIAGFPDGGQIPVRFSQAAEGAAPGEGTSPAISWSNPPAGTQSFVLNMHDMDVVRNKTTDDQAHWVVWNIPATATGLAEGAPKGPQLPDGLVTHTIRRADLYGGLADEVRRRGIPIHHGKRLVDAQRRAGGGVVARFADGSSAEGDVLVGADGVHSATRTIIDPANPRPRYTGLGNTGGFTRAAAVSDFDAPPGEYAMIWGRDCFFGYTVSPTGEVWWFANPPSRAEVSRGELRDLHGDRLRERLLRLLAPDRTPGAAIVRSGTGDIRLTNQYELPTVPTWHNGSMVVIGDAAHAVSPSSGQGASMAAEDAVVLARCLRDAADVPAALGRYESIRRERVERVVAWGASMNNTKKQGLVGRALRDLALPVILRRAARPKAVDNMSWLFTHHLETPSPR